MVLERSRPLDRAHSNKGEYLMQIAKRVSSYERLADTSDGFQRAVVVLEDGVSLVLSLDGPMENHSTDEGFEVRTNREGEEIFAKFRSDGSAPKSVGLAGSRSAKDAWSKKIWGE